ncbi:MAG: hypothetical protein GY855_03120 [candidate division Zixibacteria bacterium]|nr:hypothetical protein [candidate division Zixibacteria bacterium]
MTRKKLGRGLQDVSKLFQDKPSINNNSVNNNPEWGVCRIIIPDMYDPENRIPLSLVSHFSKQGYCTLYIYGSTERYRLIGVDNKEVPYYLIIKNGELLSVTYGDKLQFDNVDMDIDNEMSKIIEMLMLNIQLTLRNLGLIFFAPDNNLTYECDCLLTVLSGENLNGINQTLKNCEKYNNDTPIVALVLSDEEKAKVGTYFNTWLESNYSIDRPLSFLGVINKNNYSVDADLSAIINPTH